MIIKEVPYFRQRHDYSCGPASLKMVLTYLGVEASRAVLAMSAGSNKDIGTHYRGMINAVLAHYRRCYVKRNASITDIRRFIDMNLPVIINWYIDREKVGHFSVVVGISDKFLIINDPYHGPKKRVSIKKFKDIWHDTSGRNRNWMMAVLPQRIWIETRKGTIHTSLIPKGGRRGKGRRKREEEKVI